MKHKSLYYFTVLVFIVFIIGFKLFQSNEEKQFPAPFETIIVDGEDDDNYIKKQEWIETMHRSGPEDNWRQMDQSYRLNTQSKKQETKELPIYGKWRELGSNNQAGRTVYSYYDQPNWEVYTAADGGQIWKGEIGEDNWYSLNDHFKIPAIRFMTKFYQPNFTRLLVHSSQWYVVGMMYSDDDGQNWTLSDGLGLIANSGYIKRTVVQKDENNSIYILAKNSGNCRIYKSTDYGNSFESIHTFNHDVNYVDIWTSQVNESAVFVLAKDEFYYLDESDNLISIADVPNTQNGKTLLTGFDDGNGLFFYSMTRFNNQSYFYASEINGLNWTEKGSHSQGPFMVNSFAASTDQKDVLYFGGIEAFTSYDAGQSWILVNSWGQYYGSPEDKLHADIPSFNSFLIEPGSEFLLVNTDGGTYISYDQMENVENISLNNLRISQYYTSYTCRFDPSYTHAGSQDQGYQKSIEGLNDNALNYEQVISGDYGSMVSGDDGASLWMVYPGFAMYCPDINNSNSLLYDYFVGSNYQWLPKLMDDPTDPEKVFLAGGHITSGAHIIQGERVGGNVNYTELPFDFSNGTSANITALAYSKIDNNYRYVLTSEKDFFYSTDAGNNWTETEAFNAPGSHYFYGASIAPANETLGLVYVAGSGYSNPGVYRSTDNGETFTAITNGLPNTLAFQVVLSQDDSLLFAATEIGAFVCKTWEEQWYSLSDGIVPEQAFWAVDFVEPLNLARFSTYGRGIWDFELDPDVLADFEASETFIATNETIDFTDLSSFSPISWEWYFEGGIPETSNEQNPTGILYSQIGDFDVRLVVSNDQSIDTILKTDYITVGTVDISNSTENENISIFPNPVKTVFRIKAKNDIDRIYIYSTTGKLCLTINNPEVIDISDLPKGAYLVEVIIDNKKVIKKLIKE